MNGLDVLAFSALFKEAYEKCFGHPAANPLSETESKLFSNKIFEQTGLVIGAKSIKNYSLFVLNSTEAKQENPSVATMDTLARFVLNAPYIDEVQRKNNESHYPYWFQYKEAFHRSIKKPVEKKFSLKMLILGIVLAGSIFLLFLFFRQNKNESIAFTDPFETVSQDSLSARGWFVKAKDDIYWNKRNENPGYLTLFTLKGDNWPDSLNKPVIKNLLLRKVSADCFTTEIHLSEFLPAQNWQQAGILLMEDTTFTGKSLRLSFAYNDFSGGFPTSKEIIVQAIISNGKNSDKPEEIVHQSIFKVDSTNEALVKQNLQYSALRIEKQGKKFRLLYSNSSMANAAFKELVSRDIEMEPAFIGLFAMKGFVDSTAAIPARFNFFGYAPEKCNKEK